MYELQQNDQSVITSDEVIKAQPLPVGASALKAEVTALTRALELAREKG